MLSTFKLFSFLFDACRSEETSSVREAGSLNLLSVWIYCPLCTCKSVVKMLWSQLPKSNEVGLQKLHPAPFPPLLAQHLPLGSSLTYKGNVSHCNLRVNASGSKAFIFLLSVLPCTWEGPKRLSALSQHQPSLLLELFSSRAAGASPCLWVCFQDGRKYMPLSLSSFPQLLWEGGCRSVSQAVAVLLWLRGTWCVMAAGMLSCYLHCHFHSVVCSMSCKKATTLCI